MCGVECVLCWNVCVVECGRRGKGSVVPGGTYDFYKEDRGRIGLLVANVGNFVYRRYTGRTFRVIRRANMLGPGNSSTGFTLGRIPGPVRVGRCLSRCVVKRRRTGHRLTITICGRCGHLRRPRSGRNIRVRGDGVVVINDANANGALLTHAVTGLLSMPFAVISTAMFARTNCMNRSIRDVLSHLLRMTSCGIRTTRHNVIFVSRVSGVTHGDSGPSVAHSMDKRNMRRKLLGLLRKAVIGMPPGNKHGRPSRSCVRISAGGVLFVYNNTFSNVRHGVTRHLGARIMNCGSMRGITGMSGGSLVGCVLPRSLGSFNLVPRVVNHLPILACLGPLSESTLHGVLMRPGGSVIGRCVGLFRVSNVGLDFARRTLSFVMSGTIRCGLNTHKLHSVMRTIVASTVFRMPSGGVGGFRIALSCTGKRLSGTRLKRLRSTWKKFQRTSFFMGVVGSIKERSQLVSVCRVGACGVGIKCSKANGSCEAIRALFQFQFIWEQTKVCRRRPSKERQCIYISTC